MCPWDREQVWLDPKTGDIYNKVTGEPINGGYFPCLPRYGVLLKPDQTSARKKDGKQLVASMKK